MLDIQRKELKYIISVTEMLQLKKTLKYFMSGDSHNGLGGYKVRSLYFDTLSDSDFEEKVDGYDKRQKIRLRLYHEQDQYVKLEVKAKEMDRQRKTSMLLSKKEAECMIHGNYSFLMERPEKHAAALYTKMVTCGYRPKCIVEYDRFALIRDTNDTRVTFDQNLRAAEGNLNLFDENLMLYPVGAPSEITMEVKYNRFLFSDIKQELSKIDKFQVSNSKYCRARMISKRGRF